jgi:putative membrane protein
MPGIIIRWLITTLAIVIVPHLISGVRIDSFGTALAAAAILGIFNALVRPILIILTLPLTIVTLGVFILVINALLFQLAGAIVSGLHIDSFWSAFLGSLIVTLVSWCVNYSIAGPSEQGTIYVTHRRVHRGDPNSIDMQRRNDGKWE